MNQTLAALPLTNGTTYYNKYQLQRLIGRGGFGEVWLARDLALNHDYAIKVLNPGITIDERLREAQVGHAFTHNNLVRVHQADVATDGKVVIAMDYFPDGAITTLVNPGNFIALPLALRSAVDMLRGLEHLHLHGVFHNDVKPQNLLRGPQGQAKLADYGIAGVSINGAPVQPSSWYRLHASPETVAGHGIEARTDVFQCGLTLFRLLTGLGTLEAKYNSMGEAAYNTAMATGTLISRADFPAFVPSSVCRAVLRAIDPNPSNRFQSALEMRRTLETFSFPGYWTIAPTGEFEGHDSRHTYRFSVSPSSSTSTTVEVFKTNRESGRETRISKLTKRNVRNSEARRAVDAAMKAVVMGQTQ